MASAGERVGKYELLEPIGAGGMAEVWRATVRGAAGFRKEVALKMIRGDWAQDVSFVNMFVDEARLSAQLEHPNVVATLDFGCVGGRYFLAMEMVEGVALRTCQKHLRDRELALGDELSAFVVAEVAAALHYAHTAADGEGRPFGLVHRDVNPSNIMVSSHGEVKLSDFGIAKAAGRSTQTEAGTLKGKIGYMSPEQAWGKELDWRSDVYALGLTLFELLEGRRALDGENEIQVLDKARAGAAARCGVAVPPSLRAIVARALEREPAKRYASAGAMREELQRFLARVTRRDFGGELAALVREVVQRRSTGAMPVVAPVEGTEVGTSKPRHWAAAIGTAGTEPTEAGTGVNTPPSGITPVRPPSGPATAPLPTLTDGESTHTALVDEPPARHRRWPLLVGGAVLVALAAAALVTLRPGRSPTVATPTTNPPVAAAVDAAIPVAVAAPAPRVVRRATPPPPSLPRPVVVAASGERATLRIQVEPWGEVWLDGKSLGMSPLPPQEVAAGAHTLRAANARLGTHAERQLQVSPGEARAVRLDLRTP